MATTIYNTHQLAHMVSVIHKPDTFLRDMFFKRSIVSNAEYLDIYTEVETQTIAKFVAPCVESNIVRADDNSVKSIKPAYVKEKTAIELCDFSERLPEEPYNGSLTPAQRRDIVYGKAMQKIENRIMRLEEWMCAEILKSGSVTISGEKYPSVTLDFARDAGNDIDLSGGATAWDQATSTPITDMEDVSEIAFESGGEAVTDYLMDSLSWKLLRKHQDFNDLLDKRRGVIDSQVPNIAPRKFKRAVFLGMLGEFRLWLYNGKYKDDTGTVVKLIPDNTVIGVAAESFMGGMGYGAIKDHESLIAAPRFSKMWQKEDPSELYMQLQSAPVAFPGNVNASCVIKVA